MEQRCFVLIAAPSTNHQGDWDLPGVRSDAELLRATLATASYRTFFLLDGDATRARIMQSIRLIAELAGEADQVVVVFLGHAMDSASARGGAEYVLLPYDAGSATAGQRGIAASDLARALSGINARDLVLILDCCHAGGFATRDWLAAMGDGLRAWKNRLVVASTRAADPAWDHPDGGLFIPALAAALLGVGVTRDQHGRIAFQKAASEAAEVVDREARRLGIRQEVVFAQMGGLIRVIGSPSPAYQPDVVVRWYNGQDDAFRAEVRRLVATSRNMTLIGTGLSIVFDRQVTELLLQRADNAEIAICMGNAFSPHVQSRLIEEAMRMSLAPDARRRLIDNAESFVEWLGNVQLSGRTAPTVKVFDNYPTFATLIFDDDIFVYPYGYTVLGTDSPILRFRNDGSDLASYWIDNAERILRDATPVDTIIRARRDPTFFRKEWIGAAVYIIPEASNGLYRLGSRLLGYDIHARRTLPRDDSPLPGLRDYVGEAATYGFHATLSDAVYFPSEAGIERVKAELRFLADDVPPFELTGLAVAAPYHANRAVAAITFRDPSARIDALHHELIFRVNRLAITSNYRAGLVPTGASTGDGQPDFLIEDYLARYIFKAYDPHFTLCHDCPVDPGIAEDIARRVGQQLEPLPTTLTVGAIHLVVRRPGQDRWTIESTFQLRG